MHTISSVTSAFCASFQLFRAGTEMSKLIVSKLSKDHRDLSSEHTFSLHVNCHTADESSADGFNRSSSPRITGKIQDSENLCSYCREVVSTCNGLRMVTYLSSMG